jgi:TolB-like protein
MSGESKMSQKLFVSVLLLFFQFFAHSQNLDDGIEKLSAEITIGMTESNKKKIAVVEFSDLDGKITELGKYLSEELITKLFMSKKFDVVERQLLNKILEEHKLNLSGLIDETTAKQLGKILGVDAICTGTITDLVNSIKINARTISTETGSIFSVASVQINKDDKVNKLMGKVSYVSSKKIGGDNKTISGKLIYYEDFSNIEDGLIPEGWVGGSTLVTKSLGSKKVLTNFQSGNHSFSIPNIPFPDNFKLEFEMIIYSHCCNPVKIDIGNLSCGLHTNGYSWLGNSQWTFNRAFAHKSDSDYFSWIKETILVTVERRGSVFKIYVKGRQWALIRMSNFRANSINFSFEGNFAIYKISLYEI